MHRTRSVDYAVVLSGEIDMMLDDTTVHLKPGETIVQQATNHAWVNHGTRGLSNPVRADGFQTALNGPITAGCSVVAAITNWT